MSCGGTYVSRTNYRFRAVFANPAYPRLSHGLLYPGVSLRDLGGAPSDRIYEVLPRSRAGENRHDSGPPALAHGVPLAVMPFAALL
jgi:hypothetical protein